MITETDFPRSLFEAYAEGKLTRNAFESYFSEWQKRNGANFDCKGSADSKGVYVHYRGKKATRPYRAICLFGAPESSPQGLAGDSLTGRAQRVCLSSAGRWTLRSSKKNCGKEAADAGS